MKRKIFYGLLMIAMCACETQAPKNENNNENTENVASQDSDSVNANITCAEPAVAEDQTAQPDAPKTPKKVNALDKDNILGVRFMGYYADYARLKSSNNYIKAAHVFPEIAQKEDFSLKANGEEVYLIIAKFDSAKVTINELTFDMLLNGQDENDGKILFEGQPNTAYLIRCNASDTHSNINIRVETNDGKAFNYSPRLSLKDGSLITSNANVAEIIFK